MASIAGPSKQSAENAKSVIESLIKSKSDRVKFAEKPRSKSDVWKAFQTVEVDGKMVNFVRCRDCGVLLAWNSEKTGTNSLRTHVSIHEREVKKNESPKSQSKITAFVKQNSVSVSAPDKEIIRLNQVVVQGFAGDLMAINSVDGSGFRMICQEFLNFGAAFGPCDVDKVLQSRHTLKRQRLEEVRSKIFMRIKGSIEQALSFPKMSFTFDLWSDKYKQQNFLSLTVHYFDKAGKLRSTCLGLIDFEEKKTIENIRSKIKIKLEEFLESSPKVDLVMSSSVSVTDGGSNVKTVFAQRFECQCHLMNLIITHLLEDKIAKEDYAEVVDSLEALKKLVGYMKRSGNNSKLSKSLKQVVPTRWNGILAMLKSYNDVSVEVQTILLEAKQQTRLFGINDKMHSELIELLQPFETFTNTLSQDKKPTFHLISRIHNHLIKHVIRMKERDDVELNQAFYERCLLLCKRYLQTHMMHYCATLLIPVYRQLKHTDELTKSRVYDEFRRMLENVRLDAVEPQVDVTQPSKKKPKILDEDFDSASDDEYLEPDVQLNELDCYLKHHFSNRDLGVNRIEDFDVEQFDIANFWQNHARTFPRISMIASWLLAIPASSASDERTFSSTGATLTPRRTNLSAGTLSALTFIHMNKDFWVDGWTLFIYNIKKYRHL